MANKTISAQTGIARNTVKKYMVRFCWSSANLRRNRRTK